MSSKSLYQRRYKENAAGFKIGKFAITDVQQSTLQLQEQRLKKSSTSKSSRQKAIEAESLALGIDPNMVMSGMH